MIAYVIHGLMNSGNESTGMDRFADVLREDGFFEKVVELDYPWFGPIRAKCCNSTAAHMIANLVEPGQAVFTHSNGAAIAWRAASHYGAKFGYVCLLNPALRKSATFPGADAVDTWCADDDRVVGLSRWASLVAGGVWGKQGLVGYQGQNSRHYNNYLGRLGHSGVFDDPATMRMVRRIAQARITASTAVGK